MLIGDIITAKEFWKNTHKTSRYIKVLFHFVFRQFVNLKVFAGCGKLKVFVAFGVVVCIVGLINRKQTN